MNEFIIAEESRKVITPTEAKIETFYFIKRKVKTIFGKIKLVDFKVKESYGDDSYRIRPEFYSLEKARKYLWELEFVLGKRI